MRAIFDPRMMCGIGEYFRHLCTIEVATEEANSFGEVNRTWAELSNHERIPCTVGPLPGQPAPQERRRQDGTMAFETHHIVLRGYYPDIDSEHRAVVNGVVYNILTAESDSHRETTRLRVEVQR